MGGGLLWFFFNDVRLRPPQVLPVTAAVAPNITFVTPTHDAHDKEGLFDLEPLFLPTTHNASVLSLPVQAIREPGSMSFLVPPKFVISESGGGISLADPIAVPAKPIEVLNLGEAPNPWPEVGRGDVDIVALEHRLAYVEVDSAKNGKILISEAVFNDAVSKPPTDDWAPMEFLVAIDTSGLVGEPVTTSSTTSDEVETFFRTFLTKQFQLGARLSPGFYTVRIGP